MAGFLVLDLQAQMLRGQIIIVTVIIMMMFRVVHVIIIVTVIMIMMGRVVLVIIIVTDIMMMMSRVVSTDLPGSLLPRSQSPLCR